LVHDKWRPTAAEENTYPMISLVAKLKALKSIVIAWEIRKKKDLKAKLEEVEKNTHDYFLTSKNGILSYADKELIRSLLPHKEKILRLEEETWKLKSRAI